MANEGSKKGGKTDAVGAETENSDNGQENLKSFLVGLATDPSRLGAFIRDPDSEMTAAGIGEAEAAVLKSGNAGAIYGLLSGQAGAQAQPPVTILIIDADQKEGEAAQLSVRGQDPNMLYPMVMPSAEQAAAGLLQMVPHITWPQYSQFPPLQLHWPQWPIHPLQLTPLQLVPHITPQIFSPHVAPAQAGLFPTIQIHPQLVIHPQVVIHPQIHPQLVIQPQIHPQLVIQPQIHPQLVIQPQIHPQLVIQPQIHPQLVIQPQIHPQLVIQPQIHPQLVVQPQIHPQLVIQPQIHPQLVFPQIRPQILFSPGPAQAGLFPQLQIHPQIVVHPQIHPQLVVQPQIHPQIVVHPQIHPQIVVHPQIHPQIVVHPQIHPQLVMPSWAPQQQYPGWY